MRTCLSSQRTRATPPLALTGAPGAAGAELAARVVGVGTRPGAAVLGAGSDAAGTRPAMVGPAGSGGLTDAPDRGLPALDDGLADELGSAAASPTVGRALCRSSTTPRAM